MRQGEMKPTEGGQGKWESAVEELNEYERIL